MTQRALRRLRGLVQPLRNRWRRSLQVRVVATTLVVSTVVIALLGLVVLGQVRDGLLDAKTRVALAEATAGLQNAERELGAADRTDPASLRQLLDQILISLANRGGTALFDVVIRELDDAPGAAGAAGLTSCDEVCAASVPTDLRAFVAGRDLQGYTYTRIRHGDGTSQPGLVVGAPLTSLRAGSYELYYLFPLTQEQETLGLVQRTLAFAGIALAALLAGIAALVTRQAAAPVRAAARTAEEFSAGNLEERMTVRGEDELARLATSFNTMAEGLQRQIRQLEELSRVQRRFVSDVSHELRTPLTTVRMAADVLHESRESFDPAVARSAELLQAQLDRFEELLVDLLEISKHDAGAVVLEAEAVDLRPLVARAVAAAAPLAQQRGSAVNVSAPQDPAVAEVDSRRIERILRNLLVNAIEHGEGKAIDVRVEADEHAVAVTVRDFGVGLHPAEAGLVFNRFWRADPSRARGTGGTGLGLSIALEDAHLHGGWLQVWGEPGRGALFRLTLPRQAGASLSSSPLPLVPDDPGGQGRALIAAPARDDPSGPSTQDSVPVETTARRDG